MPRPLRIEFENAWYHVMNRGANRQSIYRSNVHRNMFISILGEVVDQFKIQIHAYCLMNNHYHLLIKTPYANLSKAMKHLDSVYSLRFNRSVRRDGPLFRGRYKAILVDSDEYLLQVSRYIHLNPVEAKICADPLDFQWSSYRAYAEEHQSLVWLNTFAILNQISGENVRKSYVDYVHQGVDRKTLKFYSKVHLSPIYGSKNFVNAKMDILDHGYKSIVSSDVNRLKAFPSKDAVLECVMSYFGISFGILSESIQGKRNIYKLIVMYLLRKNAMLSHKEIASIFIKMKCKSVGIIIDRFKKNMEKDELLRNDLKNIILRLDDL